MIIFLIFSLTRFYYEHLKSCLKIGNTVTFLEYRYVLT